MLTPGSRRYDKEIVLASSSAALALLTLVWQDWLEVTGWNPDHRDGAVEWMIAAALLLVGLLFGLRGATQPVRRPSEDAKATSRWH